MRKARIERCITAIFLLAPAITAAQASDAPGCADQPVYGMFDFWVGEGLNRTALTRIEAGIVRQLIEFSRDNGATWRTTFDAVYRRVEGG